jgi:hypothetical protein
MALPWPCPSHGEHTAECVLWWLSRALCGSAGPPVRSCMCACSWTRQQDGKRLGLGPPKRKIHGDAGVLKAMMACMETHGGTLWWHRHKATDAVASRCRGEAVQCRPSWFTDVVVRGGVLYSGDLPIVANGSAARSASSPPFPSLLCDLAMPPVAAEWLGRGLGHRAAYIAKPRQGRGGRWWWVVEGSVEGYDAP